MNIIVKLPEVLRGHQVDIETAIRAAINDEVNVRFEFQDLVVAKLSDLAGLHILTGCDVIGGECNSIRFILDGKTYEAIEDSNDGYRSAMEAIYETDSPVSNKFSPHDVLCVMSDREGGEVLVLWDMKSGRDVLRVGTEHTDDYYPSFVCEFDPRNLWVNKDKPLFPSNM